jgi:hypothetical protein
MFVPMGRDGVAHFRLYSSYTRRWPVRTSSPRALCLSETGSVATQKKIGALALHVLRTGQLDPPWLNGVVQVNAATLALWWEMVAELVDGVVAANVA